ncbi:MAG: ATP-dependent Clp protease proteolytic subunit [Elusimicrobiota bacterium]
MPDRTVYIKFFAGVDENTIKKLMSVVERKLSEGATSFGVLISSRGGSVFAGVSGYNFLKGIPATVHTHNFGSVISVGAVLYCAGKRRFSVPHGTFLLHGVQSNFPRGAALEEKQLEERLKGLRIDTENIAGIIAATVGKKEEDVLSDMQERTTLNPEEALRYGLVHEIREPLFEKGAELITIQ